jgi:Fur family ferric uptake transcriptional regulator
MLQHGLRWTAQRRVVCDVFFASTDHVSLESILSRARAKDQRIGYTTVYRTMRVLVQSGVAHKRQFGEGVTRYELRDVEAHHDHLICLRCGKIVEFKEPRIEQLQEEVALRHGFRVHYHKHELYCVCLDECSPAPHDPKRR